MKIVFQLLISCLLFSSSAFSGDSRKGALKVADWLSQSHLSGYEVKNAKDDGLTGFSGDPVYLIFSSDSRLAFVAKFFDGETSVEHFRSEILGTEFLNHLKLQMSEPPEVVYTREEKFKGEDDFALMVMKAADGAPFRRYMIELSDQSRGSSERSHSLNEIKKASFRVGCALAELDFRVRGPITGLEKALMSRFVQQLTKSVADLEKAQDLFPEFKSSAVLNRFYDLWNAFEKNSGGLGYTHGDASAGNVLFDSRTQRVTLIDLATLTRSVPSFDRPAGIPAYEYHQFLSSLRITQQMDELSIEDREPSEIYSEFTNGYESFSPQSRRTMEADQLFDFLWRIKEIPILLGKYRDLIRLKQDSNHVKLAILEAYHKAIGPI